MKKYMIITGLCVLTALSGCANTGEKSKSSIYEKSGNTINIADRTDLYNDGKNHKNQNADFGYVRHQKSPIAGDTKVYDTMPTLDREKVADLISKISTQMPNVHDAATLVTDEEVLIAYQTDSEDRFQTAEQVKLSAMSVVPRFYHVYVSDDPAMIKEIERFAPLKTTNRNVDQIITSTIQRMLKSPQGKKVNDIEDANGEDENGINPQYQRDMEDLPDRFKNPNTK
ncbi:YhcN/YlaJ family sporulation lipoprotein [Fredinandcohnia quinoae]|uniref:YhcN/YlaJ family sporulation lipoprotein n=1 Tax=Fredinandcohnia quinoae TaxID=2918902 RepID=A0AAW5DY03_9BACI|nr:YhcN/YlaJ family sporulation lipoprotein [Fredinandcohnia sp. SECRCQ15]MCH1625545.1 YhcN/YlaJ family sporulation lipoprotein [Fredinandcohnia sp. SECRCQ15]